MSGHRTINAVTHLVDIGNVAVIAVDSPPVNALGHLVRSGIVTAIEQLSERPIRPRAVVLTCAGRTFFAGADIKEIGQPPQQPDFPAMLKVAEDAPFPLIAAIHGTALGGGLELAMTCHFRVATTDAQLGLPEVKLGLLPGAGGTQRLPRLVGVGHALEMMVSGNPISAAEALTRGLVDETGDQDARSLGIDFARRLPAHEPRRRVRDREEHLIVARADAGIFERFRVEHGRRFRGQDAPEKIIRCVEAAVSLPFEQGLAIERELFTELERGSQSAALRHVFFAERLAQRPEAIRGATPLPVARAGVVGAGTMGRGIALALAAAGLQVIVVDTLPGAAEGALAQMADALRGSASRGRFPAAEAEARIARIEAGEDLADLTGCEIVIEAVFEEMTVKAKVFGELDVLLAPQAILASNTSYLDINEIAAGTSRPERVLGMHFFSPANIMRLVEVVQGRATAPDVLATAFALARKMEKVAVLSGVCHGFVGNRMLEKRQDEAMQLILEGATPTQVDRVATAFGFPMGPFAMHDLAGLDLGWSAEASKGETIRDLLCEAGRRGQKTGSGFFDYGPDRKPISSAEVETLIRAFSASRGYRAQDLGDDEIRDRLVLPMINEGACILAENIAERASDIDLVWINGYGWPSVSGGPMYWAEKTGLKDIVRRLEALEPRHGGRFSPSVALRQAANRNAWA